MWAKHAKPSKVFGNLRGPNNVVSNDALWCFDLISEIDKT